MVIISLLYFNKINRSIFNTKNWV